MRDTRRRDAKRLPRMMLPAAALALAQLSQLATSNGAGKPECPAAPHGAAVSEVPCMHIPQCEEPHEQREWYEGAASAGVATNFTVLGDSGGVARPPLVAEHTTATVCWTDTLIRVKWSAVDANVVCNVVIFDSGFFSCNGHMYIEFMVFN